MATGLEPLATPPVDGPRPGHVTVGNLWDLEADPGAVRRAAQAWLDLSKTTDHEADAVDKPARRVYAGPWAGDAADTYNHHRSRLTGDIREASQLARGAARTLETVAAVLTSAQNMLSASWHTITVRCGVVVQGGKVTFLPADDADVAAINAAVSEAKEIRSDLDAKLLDSVGDLSKAEPALAVIARAWKSVAAGRKDPFDVPPEAKRTGVLFDPKQNRFIVNGGAGDDKISVRVDPKTGERIVVVNGQEYVMPPGTRLTVRGGSGNDTVTVQPGTELNLTVLGSDGNDTVTTGAGHDRVLGGDGSDVVTSSDGNDRVSGGADPDYIDGQGGNDVLRGDAADDIVYGLSGDDRIAGGDGSDYLESGADRDTVDGGTGDDVVSGDRDADTIQTSAGEDVVLRR